MPQLLKIKQEGDALGVPSLKIVDRAWLNEHEPNLNPEALAALYAPTAGIISPYRLVYALAENAARNGVEIFLEHKVTVIAKDGKNLRLNAAVSGSERVFEAKYVINAAGLFADDVARLAGITDFVIKPRKGEEFLLDKKREHIVNHIIFPLPTPTSKGILVIKTSDGNPMIGPTAQDIEDKEDLTTTEQGLKTVLAAVQKMVPTISANDIIAYFAGLRPTVGKDFIIRHEAKAPGLITVAGIQSPGLTAGPAIALLVADLLKQNGLRLRKKLFFKKHRQAIIHKEPGYGDIVCRCEMISAKEVRDAVRRGATTLDGIKFRTRAQAGRCHGGFCTTRIMKIMAEELNVPLTKITKRGKGSEIIKNVRA